MADADSAVDLALVLAVDCSSSIDPVDFRIQMDGFAAALRYPALRRAIATGTHRRIALTLMLWSGAEPPGIAVPWLVLETGADVEAAARAIDALQPPWRPGGTALAAAIDFAVSLLVTFPRPAERRVIDVSGDGWDNVGGNAALARDRAVALGMTVNGLPIINGSKLLLEYYRKQVIGGPGAFLEPAEDLQSFRKSILKKLVREIQLT